MRLSLLALAVTLVACDSDSAQELLNPEEPDVGPAMVEVEAAAEDLIVDLEADGRDALCAAWYAAVDEQVPISTQCQVVALAASARSMDEDGAERADGCSDEADICTRAALIGEQSPPPLPAGPCFLAEPTEDCTATVGALLPCLNAMADAAVTNFRAVVTCDLARGADFDVPSLSAPDNSELMECGQVTLDCPGLFGSEAEE